MTLRRRCRGRCDRSWRLRPPRPGYVVGFVQDDGLRAGPRRSRLGRLDRRTEVVTDAQGDSSISCPRTSGRRHRHHRAADRLSTRSPGPAIRVGPGARDSHTLTLDTSELSIADPFIVTGVSRASPPRRGQPAARGSPDLVVHADRGRAARSDRERRRDGRPLRQRRPLRVRRAGRGTATT